MTSPLKQQAISRQMLGSDVPMQSMGPLPAAFDFAESGMAPASNASGEKQGFRVEDTVLARTSGKPARKATIIEADPSDNSRFKIAFKDKRRKGGWIDKRDLSLLFMPPTGPTLHTPASSPTLAAQSSAVSAYSAANIPALLSDPGSATGSPAPPPPNTNGKSVTPTYESNQRPTLVMGDTSKETAAAPAVARKAGVFSIGDGVLTPVRPGSIYLGISQQMTDRSDRPVESMGPLPTTFDFAESGMTPASNASGEKQGFRVEDTVLARTSGKPAREATIIEADPSDNSRFKIAFKDKRKKGGWRDQSDLSLLFIPPTGPIFPSLASSPTLAAPHYFVPARSAAITPAAATVPAARGPGSATSTLALPQHIVYNDTDTLMTGSSHRPILAIEGTSEETAAPPAAARKARVFSIGDEVLTPVRPSSIRLGISRQVLGCDVPTQSMGPLPVTLNSTESGMIAAPGGSGEKQGFQIGDTVLARTFGKPAREATIIEANPSGSSRFKIAFKDKRKKGGWRDKSELFLFCLPNAGAALPAVRCAPASSPPPIALPTVVPASSTYSPPTAVDPGSVAGGSAAPPPPISCGDGGEPSIKSNHRSTSATGDIIEETTAAPAAAGKVDIFCIGGGVLIPARPGSTNLLEATLMSVDKSKNPVLWKLRFRDRRKKEIWLAAGDFIPGSYVPQENGQSAESSVPVRSFPSSQTKKRTHGEAAEHGVRLAYRGVAKPSRGGHDLVGNHSIKSGGNASNLPIPSTADASAGDYGGMQQRRGYSPSSTSSPVDKDTVNTTAIVNASGKVTPRVHNSMQDIRTVSGVLVSAEGASSVCGSTSLGSTSSLKTMERVRLETQVRKPQGVGQQPQAQFKNKSFALVPVNRNDVLQTGTVVEVDTSNQPCSDICVDDIRYKDPSRAGEQKTISIVAPVPADQRRGDNLQVEQTPRVSTPSCSVEKITTDTHPNESQPKKQKRATSMLSRLRTDLKEARFFPAERTNEGADASAMKQNRTLQKRAATLAVARTISSTSSGAASTTHRDNSQPQLQAQARQETNGAKKISSRKKEKSKAKLSPTPAVSKARRAPDWKRPIVVIPGTSEGRPESALRTTHPTEAVRPRKKFKIQQARTTSKVKSDSSVSNTSHLSFTATTTAAVRSTTLSRPLCQPSHSLQDFQQGIAGNQKGTLGRGEEDDSGVRRGRRTRRQVHQTLSEDKMTAAYEDSDSDDEENRCLGEDEVENGIAGEEAPLRFRKSADAPWGAGDKPLVKVRLSLHKDGAPLCAERSALLVATFVFDRHRYSSKQLANVLTTEGFLCYSCDESTRVFVLTERKEADQKEALKRIRNLALSRCGVQVEVTLHLTGRPALDEFLDNHRRVLDHIIRHRLASGMWSEVNGVYFNALFCGRRSKRTFNGVRLDINLAASHNSALETGVWELWMAVEPAVHRFSPVDWWALIQEKQEKGLSDFSGSKSDDLEERLQVVCLPKLSRGIVYDVKEDEFDMDSLQVANLKRGFFVGPRSEDEMAEYWRQVHHINLPSTNFVFVKVRVGSMVFTYPSWCVVRGQVEVPGATKALRGRILDSFTDALDAMSGIKVLETTFSWHMVCSAPAFATANGTVVGQNRKTGSSRCLIPSADSMYGNYIASISVTPSRPHGTTIGTNIFTSGPAIEAGRGEEDRRGQGSKSDQRESTSAPIVTPQAIGTIFYRDETPSVVLGQNTTKSTTDEQRSTNAREDSPQCKAAAAAARASVAAVRQSVIRRRESEPRNSLSPTAPAAVQDKVTGRVTTGAAEQGLSTTTRLCSTKFVIRRPPPSSSSAVSNQSTRTQSTRGLEKSRPFGTIGKTVDSGGYGENAGRDKTTEARGLGNFAGTTPGTPQAVGKETTPTRLVTPAAKDRTVDPEGTETVGPNQEHSEDSSSSSLLSENSRRKMVDDVVLGKEAVTGNSRDMRGTQPEDGLCGGGAPEQRLEEAPTDVVAVSKPQSEPAKIVVCFSATGSLGVGLEEDGTEEGTVMLAGKAPTSAAAPVPVGWRLSEVDGKNVRRLGADKIAILLKPRPVAVTFEAIPKEGAGTAPAPEKARADTKNVSKSSAASTNRKKAPTKPKSGMTTKGKKATKVTTVRKTFKVQSRGQGANGQSNAGAAAGGKSAAATGAAATAAVYTPAALPESADIVVI